MVKEKPGENAVFNFIADYEVKHNTHPEVEYICSKLQRDKKTVTRHINNMIESGRLDNKYGVYITPKEMYDVSHRTKRERARTTAAIWKSDIMDAKKRVKVGDRVLIEDVRFPDRRNCSACRVVRAVVASKHKRVVCLKYGVYSPKDINGNATLRTTQRLYCTYAQLAKWYRNRKVAIE